ncbi:MAG: methionyl-tRNA formyltransferase [Chlorobi bacterium]|nr:methionyl-tRNA formyltransferase [Chlorobiota bacterium]
MKYKKEDLRIVFMGTPDFAVESLKILVENGFNIAGVITSPDKPAGRGQKIKKSPVKLYAEKAQLKVLQPVNLKDPEFLEELRSLNAGLQVVVAFRMLPEVVWNMPPLGTFNLHASLLPQYRGAAPINWAVMNGEKETGVTTFFLRHEIDTGNIILQEKIEIGPDDNAGIVHDKLMILGAKLVLKTVNLILEDKVEPVPQDKIAGGEELKPAPKIFKEDCRIDWSRPAQVIHNKIRGLSPYPAAWSRIVLNTGEKIQVKIYESELMNCDSALPGVVNSDGRHFIEVGTGNGCVRIKRLQLAGKKQLPVQDFLRGFDISTVTGFE